MQSHFPSNHYSAWLHWLGQLQLERRSLGNLPLECSGGRKSSKHLVLHDTGSTPSAQLLHQLLVRQHRVHCSLLSSVFLVYFSKWLKQRAHRKFRWLIRSFHWFSSFECWQAVEASAKCHYCEMVCLKVPLITLNWKKTIDDEKSDNKNSLFLVTLRADLQPN